MPRRENDFDSKRRRKKSLTSRFPMAENVESKDCTLPAFAHSLPLKLSSKKVDPSFSSGRCGSLMVSLREKEGRPCLVSVRTSDLVRNSLGSDATSALKSVVNASCDTQYLPEIVTFESKVRILASTGDSMIVSSDTKVLVYLVSKDGEFSLSTTVDIRESIFAASAASGCKFVILTISGKLYLIGKDDKSIGAPFSTDCPAFGRMSLIDDKFICVPDRDKLWSIDISSGSTKEYALGELAETLEVSQVEVQGLTSLSSGSFALLLKAGEGDESSVAVAICRFDSGKITCDHYSVNEIFISSDQSEPVGHLEYISSLDILLAGHSGSESIALYKRSIGESAEWSCLIMPEGKQLNCSLIDGEATTAFTRKISAIVLDTPVQVPKQNEMFHCHLAIVTTQIDGWATVHYGDIPPDWKLKEPKPVSPFTPAKAPICTNFFDQPVTTESQPKPIGLFSSPAPTTGGSLFGPFGAPVATGTSQNVFGQSSFGQVSPTIIGQGVTKKESAPVPPASCVSIEAESTNLFGDAGVKKGASPESPKRDQSAKPSSSTVLSEIGSKKDAAPAPPLFKPSLQPSVNLFGDARANKEAAPAPPVFDKSVKPPSSSLFGSFGAPKLSGASQSSFGQSSLGQGSLKVPDDKDAKQDVAPAPPTFKPSIQPPSNLFGDAGAQKETAPAPPKFDKSVKPPSSVALDVAPKKEEVAVPRKPLDVASPKSKTVTGAKIDESLMKSFEDELKGWETIAKSASAAVPTIDGSRIPKAMPDSIEKEKQSIISVRDEVKRFDSEVRDLYMQDPSAASWELEAKLETKCAEINAKIDQASVSARRFNKGRISAMRTPVPAVVSSTVPSTPTKSPVIPIFHPLPPSMRKEPAGGLAMMTPVKASPARFREDRTLADLLAEPTKRPPRPSRSAVATLKTPWQRLSLGDILTGKILGSPEARSVPLAMTPEKVAPTVSTGGHGAAWQFLRKVEEQRKQMEALLKEVSEISNNRS